MKQSLLVAALLAVALSACGKKEEAPVEASAPAVEASAPEVVEASAPAVDASAADASAPAASAAQ
ncbi:MULTISPECIES: hypothetical protein [Vogesella]|uniref:Lipoprotein n=1 Tax=Vogesella indigofera TaxID=45465 RepID=A0ABT5I8H0_VOGIN|nr:MULTISPECIES: hypothetical protein [Vogesella]MCQ4145005.1 hypothetical protein [Vogesella sp. AC12]MDC7692278.1 hypothetical protein [Vogesella indigofera]MDC7699205.1 hypothetical protein [Vogesella indigofera]MDC7702583.1 hypothetical protein [Vogesella indigofera]MDC7705766.1 hypothetical protein [Vogesella indigofera]